MATVYELGEIMARRVIAVGDGEQQAQVLLGRPRPVTGGGYVCVFQIVGLDDERVQPAAGEDSMQALQRALKMIASVLHTSEAYRRNALSWNGDHDLGFEPFTEKTAQLGRRFGDEAEIRELLRLATRHVADLVRGDLSVSEFLRTYGRFYHWADLHGGIAAEEIRLLDAYADVIALHDALRPVFADALEMTPSTGPESPSHVAAAEHLAAIETQIKDIAGKFDLRRWILDLSRPTPTFH